MQWISVSSGEEKKKKSVEEKDGDVSQEVLDPLGFLRINHQSLTKPNYLKGSLSS